MMVPAGGGTPFEDGPDRGRIMVSSSDTGGAYSLMEYVIAPRGPATALQYGAHLHGAIEETFLVQEGALEFLLGEDKITLKAGDFVRVPAGTRHGFANATKADVRLLVSFVPGGFEDLFLRYRTDPGHRAIGAGFAADAAAEFGSSFETEG